MSMRIRHSTSGIISFGVMRHGPCQALTAGSGVQDEKDIQSFLSLIAFKINSKGELDGCLELLFREIWERYRSLLGKGLGVN